MQSGRWLPLLGVVAVAGCATPPAGPVVATQAPPERIDGRYVGIGRLTRADIPRGCPRSGRKIVTIERSSLSMQYRGASASYALAASVSPDGNVHGSDGRGNIEGSISGRHLDLTVSSQYCEVRYALDRG